MKSPKNGPVIFLASAIHLRREDQRDTYLQEVREALWEGADLRANPLPTADVAGKEGLAAGLALGERALVTLRSSHVVLADLSPFRGPHAYAAAAAEMGLALGLGKPVFGFTYCQPGPLEPRICKAHGFSQDYLPDEAERARAGDPDVKPTGPKWDGLSAAMVEPQGLPEANSICAMLAESAGGTILHGKTREVALARVGMAVRQWAEQEGIGLPD